MNSQRINYWSHINLSPISIFVEVDICPQRKDEGDGKQQKHSVPDNIPLSPV